MTAAIRVAIVDDEQVIRDGLGMILGSHPGLEVAGTAGDGAEALDLLESVHVDVVLLDLRMPVLDGLAVLRELRARDQPSPRVVVLTTFALDEMVRDALSAGAAGFLLKSSPHERIAAAIRAAAAGETPLSGPVAERVIGGFLSQAGPDVDPADERRLALLTARELEILELVGRGLRNGEIARDLVVSLHTVKTHVSRILSKTDLTSRGQAAALAHRCASRIRALRDA